MEKGEFILAALAPAEGAPHSPVQVQKLLFLLDRNAAPVLGGPFFHFEPYNYGPFDKEVYRSLEIFAEQGLVVITHSQAWRTYRLTSQGQALGDQLLDSLPTSIGQYFRGISTWVRSQSFPQLVSAVYKAYPEMRANSVFQEQL